MKKLQTLAASIIALAAVVMTGAPAYADPAPNIIAGQWYSFRFDNSGTPIYGPPFVTGFNGPLPGGGTAFSISAPTGTSWTINMATAGYITFTDLEISGDEFQVFINGVAATLATNNLIPSGQSGLAGGFTSASGLGSSVGEDISAALLDANYSSGTFYLPAGLDTINAQFLGYIENGDGAFFASSVPEPATWAIMLVGFGGIGFMLRRKIRSIAVPFS